MKKILIAIVLIFFLYKPNYAQSDYAYNSIAKLDLDHYAFLPVDSFLHVIPQSYNSFGLYSTLNPNGRVRGLWIRYATGLAIMIEPKIYNYMNPYDTNHVWNIDLFKKENASHILVNHPYFEGLSGSDQP